VGPAIHVFLEVEEPSMTEVVEKKKKEKKEKGCSHQAREVRGRKNRRLVLISDSRMEIDEAAGRRPKKEREKNGPKW